MTIHNPNEKFYCDQFSISKKQVDPSKGKPFTCSESAEKTTQKISKFHIKIAEAKKHSGTPAVKQRLFKNPETKILKVESNIYGRNEVVI